MRKRKKQNAKSKTRRASISKTRSDDGENQTVSLYNWFWIHWKENGGYYVSGKTLRSNLYIYLFLFYIDVTTEKQDCKMDHTPSLPIIFNFLQVAK